MGSFRGQGRDPSHDTGFHWQIQVAHWWHQWLAPFWSWKCTGYWKALPRQDILLCTDCTFLFGGHTLSIPLSRTLLLWVALAGALVTDTSSFGAALYLYTACATVYCFLAAILFTLRWQIFAMPLPLGTCAHHKLSWTPHSFRKHSNCPLRKAVSLSVRFSSGSPCS